MIRSCYKGVAFAVALGLLTSAAALAQKASSGPASDATGQANLPQRKYSEGEKVCYHMKCSNSDRTQTVNYEIEADGIVKKNEKGFFEEFAWSGMTVNGNPLALPQTSLDLRQVISLEPNTNVIMPDLSKVHPMMIGRTGGSLEAS
jgi:hypothetical protein